MAAITDEVTRICQELPEEKANELVNFARFLRQQVHAKAGQSPPNGDAAWERIISDPAPRPKLDAFVKQALEEGAAEPLDYDKL